MEKKDENQFNKLQKEEKELKKGFINKLIIFIINSKGKYRNEGIRVMEEMMRDKEVIEELLV